MQTQSLTKSLAAQSAVTQKQTSLLAAMAARYQVDPIKFKNTLAATVFKGATTEQFMALCLVANQYNLNPLTKEIFAFPSAEGIVPVVSIDGWSRIVNDHPQFDGVEFEAGTDDIGGVYVTCRMFRKDRTHPTCVTEYLKECQGSNGKTWGKCPMRMLRHRAFIQAARLAFGFSGIYAPEDDTAQPLQFADAEDIGAVPAAEAPAAPSAQQTPPAAQPAPTAADTDADPF